MKLRDRYKELKYGGISSGASLEGAGAGQKLAENLKSDLLPFDFVERIHQAADDLNCESRVPVSRPDPEESANWTNKLVRGDNKLLLSSMKDGFIRRDIEAAGGLKLIYIDPPFNVGADYSVSLQIGEEASKRQANAVQEFAYSDKWGQGADSYLSFMYERLRLMRELLAPCGSIYVHCDWRVNSSLRLIMDEIFGSHNFINEIVWKRSNNTSSIGRIWKRTHDTILFYSKTGDYCFNFQYKQLAGSSLKLYKEEDEKGRYQLVPILVSGKRRGETGRPWKGIDPNLRGRSGMHWITTPEKLDRYHEEGRIFFPDKQGGTPRLKYYLSDNKGVVVSDLWDDVRPISSGGIESLNYATQKPEALLERIILASSDEGDLVADFFCGSGTTLAVAEKFGRKWIGCDTGRLAVHTTRKRLIGTQRELRAKALPCCGFEILSIRGQERGPVMCIDPPSVEAHLNIKDDKVSVTLTGLRSSILQDELDSIIAELPPGESAFTVDEGLPVRIVKNEKGEISREFFTQKWSDWIDYWSVDFEYGNRPGVVRDNKNSRIFQSQWQNYRTRKNRSLELTSAEHSVDRHDNHIIAVQVVSIFGHETTMVLEVKGQ